MTLLWLNVPVNDFISVSIFIFSLIFKCFFIKLHWNFEIFSLVLCKSSSPWVFSLLSVCTSAVSILSVPIDIPL